MNISRIQNYTTNFTSHNKKTRQINDIQRQAVKEFPIYSPTYVQNFYVIGHSANEERKKRAQIIAQRLVFQINAMRMVEEEHENLRRRYMAGKETPYIRTLDRIKDTRIGNCYEASISGMAALAANGFYDAKRVRLVIQTDFVDKKTKEVKFSQNIPLDHAFCVTALNKKDPQEDDYIIVDPWYGFTSGISEAREKYSKIFDIDSKEDEINYNFSMYKIKTAQHTGKLINKSDYEIRKKFSFVNEDKNIESETKQLGSYARMMYPNLCK